jgi:hypothetical protein
MNIIELAKQAGLKRHQEQAPGIDGVVGNWADLEAFAALVRADEREACARVCEDDAFVEQWKGLAEAAKRIRARGQA